MIISIATLFPRLYDAFLQTSLLARAQQAGKVSFDVKTLFSVCNAGERADAPTFGHGAGMAIRPEVIERMVHVQESVHGPAYRIFFSPRGDLLNQDVLRGIVQELERDAYAHLSLFCARYEGIDSRAEEEYAHKVLSVGDFVLMGGDLPAQFFLEAYLRYVPGVVGNVESVYHDSFTGALLDAPAYTAPAVWRGKGVPPVLRSGNHKAIEEWSLREGAHAAVKKNFSWVKQHALSEAERKSVRIAIPSHYVVLMHDEIDLPGGRVGTTSVTSIDIHDIARSAATFGVKGYYIVTPLLDQASIVKTLLSFWQEGDGVGYNPHRAEALAHTAVRSSLDIVIKEVTERHEGVSPILIATSAQNSTQIPVISYHEQSKVWEDKRPVILVFGTGRGLAESVYRRMDYMLCPITGLTEFNHLSVRSAVAIILDRWLGINPSKVMEKPVTLCKK